MTTHHDTLRDLNQHISACTRCPRLVSWREAVARDKVKRFENAPYWGKGVPSFGDPDAALLIIGLAPAAHGANRTGRMFTGDRSGDWLYRALHKAGFANQAESVHSDDGLMLHNCYISAVCHCAPPQNKLTPDEIKNCRPFLEAELGAMTHCRVILALGKLAFDQAWLSLSSQNSAPHKRPAFGHGVVHELGDGRYLVGSYHPSQQNTFTGKLTEPMFDHVFNSIQTLLTPAAHAH